MRVGYYTGLRMGELRALRWRNIDFASSVLQFDRAMSAGIESTTKSGRVRIVPLADQAAAALERVSRRGDFTSPDDLVFCNVYGRGLDESALRRRYKHARAAAGSSRCVSTTCATPSAPNSPRAALTSSRSRKRWDTPR